MDASIRRERFAVTGRLPLGSTRLAPDKCQPRMPARCARGVAREEGGDTTRLRGRARRGWRSRTWRLRRQLGFEVRCHMPERNPTKAMRPSRAERPALAPSLRPAALSALGRGFARATAGAASAASRGGLRGRCIRHVICITRLTWCRRLQTARPAPVCPGVSFATPFGFFALRHLG